MHVPEPQRKDQETDKPDEPSNTASEQSETVVNDLDHAIQPRATFKAVTVFSSSLTDQLA